MKDEDIRINSWPIVPKGGQHVGMVGRGVIIEHLPTGNAVVMTSERSQAKNKNKAILYLEMILELEGWKDVSIEGQVNLRPIREN